MKKELLLEQGQENLASPEKEKHQLFIGIHGTVAAGKTELAKLLEGEFGVTLIEEKFQENPYLEDFYHEPERWSYLSQLFFFERKLKDLATMPRDKAVVLAPDQWQDRDIYAHVHRLMGWMNNGEYQEYLRKCDQLLQMADVPTPDLVISVHAPFEVILRRIERRAVTENREFELWMLENHPEYFFELSQRVEEWSRENPHDVPVMRVDSGRFNYIEEEDDAFLIANQIRREVLIQLKEREEIILPESFRPGLVIDTRAGRISKMDNRFRWRI